MTVPHVVLAVVRGAAIAVVPAAPTLTSRVLIRRAHTVRGHRDLQASRMDKADRSVRVARQAMPATQPNSAAGMCLTVSIPARARHVRAATRIPHAPDLDVPAQVVRASRVVLATSVAPARRAVPASTLVRTNHVHSTLARKAIVRKAACRVGRTQVRVAMVRKGHVLLAIDRTSNRAVRAARHRMHVRMDHVPTDPAHRVARVVRVTKGCRATRIDWAAAPGIRRRRVWGGRSRPE